jgi:hypothetical protein
MKDFDDKEVDSIIRGYFERQELLDDLNKEIISDVKLKVWKQKFLLWVKLLLICFGLPVFTVLIVYIYSTLAENYTTFNAVSASFMLSTVTIVIIGMKSYNYFIRKL